MTERQAAKLANRIYAEYSARTIDRKKAFSDLDKIYPFMSTAQILKYSDFLHCV